MRLIFNADVRVWKGANASRWLSDGEWGNRKLARRGREINASRRANFLSINLCNEVKDVSLLTVLSKKRESNKMVPHLQVKNPASSDAGASSLTSTSTDATAAASTTANDAHLILSAAASAVTGKQPPMTATGEPLKPSHRRQVGRGLIPKWIVSKTVFPPL